MKANQRKYNNKKAYSLFLKTLTEIGCLYELRADDGKLIRFIYDDKTYRAYCDYENEQEWDTISIFYFYTAIPSPMEDKWFIWMAKTLNRINVTCKITAYYNSVADEEADTPFMASKVVTEYVSRIPDLKHYLKNVLGEFSTAMAIVKEEIDRYWEDEKLMDMVKCFAKSNIDVTQN